MSAPSVNAMTNYYGASTFASVAPRDRTLDAYEIRYVERARAKAHPESWQNISDALKRSEHDIRLCCDPAYQREPQPEPAIDPAVERFDGSTIRRRIAETIERVAAAYGLKPSDLIGNGRKQGVAHARQQAMYEARQIMREDGAPQFSLLAIGQAFNRDHTTVLHAITAHGDRLAGKPKGKRKGAKPALKPVTNAAPIVASVLSAPTPGEQLAQRRAYR